MPIILNTDSNDIDKQIKDITKNIQTNKQVDAKFFSKHFTGNGKTAQGLFRSKSDTIAEFLKESTRLINNDSNVRLKDEMAHNLRNQTLNTMFRSSSKEKEDNFLPFNMTLTTIMPPIILKDILSKRIALSFPKNTGLYNMNAMDTNWIPLKKGKIDGKDATIYLKPIIESVRLHSRDKDKKDKHKLTTAGVTDMYLLTATILDDMDKDGDIIFINNKINKYDKNGYPKLKGKTINENQGILSVSELIEGQPNMYNWGFTFENVENHISLIENKNIDFKDINVDLVKNSIKDVSTSDLLKSQAMTLVHQGEEILKTSAEILSKRFHELNKKTILDMRYSPKQSLVAFIQHLDIINEFQDDLVTTDLLAEIFAIMKNNLKNQDLLNRATKHSLRLLLSKRLHELDELKNNDGLYEFKGEDRDVYAKMMADKNYSTQQKKIITSTDPLVIGQAGAGSGKSHTLIGRINYLKDQKEDLEKVLVLSFTNVSAININNRFPGVRSETLANMFHTIYSHSYPSQRLSQPSTIANGLRVINPKFFVDKENTVDDVTRFIDDFSHRLEQFDQTGFKRVDLQKELKLTANLIENNLDLTTKLLNALEQTTLEIEPIIIHHQLMKENNNLVIPKQYRELNYIITDESQDISTFEYILLLELTLHHRSQLLIIGDGSQTLYEFRNSDPRYMNALEASNVFVSHKLETNYRSNQEILTFANQFLQVIDANKYAKIQLQSSNFKRLNEKDVRENITIDENFITGRSVKDYTDGLEEYFNDAKDFEKWFIGKIRKGEQVAIMGWTRKEVMVAGEAVENILRKYNITDKEITNIMSDNQKPTILLSHFVKDRFKELRNLTPSNKTYIADIKRIGDDYVNRKGCRSDKQRNFYKMLINRAIDDITNKAKWSVMINDYKNGKFTKNQIGGYLIQDILRYEIRKNAMDQYLRKDKEVPNYDKCPIILSTIHGTKGLEFDNTVVLFNESKKGAKSQESLRMMFVALSRAKKSEFIINSYVPTQNRSVSNTMSGMFETPIPTAYMRTLDEAVNSKQTTTN